MYRLVQQGFEIALLHLLVKVVKSPHCIATFIGKGRQVCMFEKRKILDILLSNFPPIAKVAD